MNGLPSAFPEKPGQLYDLLHERFGIGFYDDIAAPQPPWWRARMTEITKLNAQLKARRVTVRQVAIAVWYAERAGTQVRWTSDLFKLIPAAMRAYNTALDEAKRRDLDAAREDAIAEAVAAGQDNWAARLYRADRRMLPELIAQWRAQ